MKVYILKCGGDNYSYNVSYFLDRGNAELWLSHYQGNGDFRDYWIVQEEIVIEVPQ